MLDLLASSIIAVFTGLLSVPTPAATPIGLWQRADMSIEARFYACNDKLCARITETKSKSRQVRNGTMLVQSAALTSHNMWEGPVLEIESGSMIAGVITMNGRDILNVKSCTALVLCRVETWNRVK
ncbi:DUF2147 domain-containing protein [Pseudolabrys sp. FHR47]|uniref:DUF2147 domain-containing protein n=1 Tax=Pseudolabrys sp. FHR47 TaxID=2562284 RepID=UPI0010BEEE1D|nr:DUF2147 domain-containing protein [Pseudolabrys sp. FHR47]